MIMIEIPPEIMNALWALVLAAVGWLMAYLQKQEKDEAVEQKAEVEAFYDPQTGNVVPPESVPTRAWKMNEETKKFMIHGESEADQAKLLAQVDVAEAEGKTDYFISYSKGWYHINFGLIMGSARGG